MSRCLQGISTSIATSPVSPDVTIMAFSGGSTPTGWDKINKVDYPELPIADADKGNGVMQKMCVSLSYIEKNDQGIWEDKALPYPTKKIGRVWQVDQTLLPIKMWDQIPVIIDPNCNRYK
jgi:hypothetical protein